MHGEKFTNSLFAPILAVAIAICAFLPFATANAEGTVATIGETQFESFDAAVAAAEDGQTITLENDAETIGLNLNKNLTINGKGNKLSFTSKGIALWGKKLTFNNTIVEMNGIGSTPYSEWSWMAICASNNSSLILEANSVMTLDGTGTSDSHAIYFTGNNKLNLTNSKLTIKNYKQDALEWDGGDGGYNVNLTNSTFISNNNRSGFTGTFFATIDNSTVDVSNSTGNGSNGSNFVIKNQSNVKFNNNGSHGLSAAKLSIDNSTVEAIANGANGIHTTSTTAITNSTVTIKDNKCTISSKWTIPGAFYIASDTTITKSTITIINNLGSGIYQKGGTLQIAEDADVTITNNIADKLGIGGGINANGASVTLPSNIKLYNNHAANQADDIFASTKTSFTLIETGDWMLDGDIDQKDCNGLADKITGWFDDSLNNRWNAHTISDQHAVEYEANNYTTELSLKAAHDLAKIEVKKTVDGLQTDEDFRFDFTLTDEEGNNVSYDYAIARQENNEENERDAVTETTNDHENAQLLIDEENQTVYFTLKDGEMICLDKIPFNFGYSITEQPLNNYLQIAENTEGVIEDEEVAVNFLNIYSEPGRGEEAENEEPKELIANPKTIDALSATIVLFAITLAGLFVSTMFIYKNIKLL